MTDAKRDMEGVARGTVLVTGGAGYIGSHTVAMLAEQGRRVVVIDNLSNGSPESIRRINEMTGTQIPLYVVDLLDKPAVMDVFAKHPDITEVVHFAALKAVGESVAAPLSYYKVNIMGTVQLVETMLAHSVHRIIFSSSATVYGDPQYLPMDEKHPTGQCTSPYAKTKLFVEEVLRDVCHVHPQLTAVVLRYFNPVGAHASGMLGEDPQGLPNNLTPYIAQVAIGKRPELLVFGDDYDTADGTGVRDYIHITDLARGHVVAMDKMAAMTGFKAYNLGTGRGSSVMEVLAAFEKAVGNKIPRKIVGRRAGDVAAMCACANKAEQELGWKATKTLQQMCEDLWNWQVKNPDGFPKTENGEVKKGHEQTNGNV